MFTGIVEGMGMVKDIKKEGSNYVFYMHANFINDLKVNQSLSHNGVCLTVTEVGNNYYTVTAVDETLKKTNLGDLEIGDAINLERAMSTITGLTVISFRDMSTRPVSVPLSQTWMAAGFLTSYTIRNQPAISLLKKDPYASTGSA
jgi:hypothetical protein